MTSDHTPLESGVPQGSVLGPMLFTLYTTPMRRIFKKHRIKYQKYADDTQMFVEYDPSVPGAREEAIQRLIACFNELLMWMARWMLKLNDNKTEMVIFMSKYHLQKYGLSTMAVGNSTIVPVACVCDLGVQLDQHLNMDQHVRAVCRACNYHLRRLCCICRYLTTDATKNAVQALITSRLDYCNSLL